MAYFIIGISVLIVIFIVIMFLKYCKLKDFSKIIEVCSNNIDETLNRQIKEIDKILKYVEDDKIKNYYVIKDSFDLFDKEDVVFNTSWNINKYFEDKKVKDDNKVILRNISNIEEELEGLKDYYNLNSIRYNELYNKVPFVYIFKLLKLDSKKVFKLRKLENYEILKD